MEPGSAGRTGERIELYVAGDYLELLDVDGGEDIVGQQALAYEYRVLEVVAAPRHERDEHILSESKLAVHTGRALELIDAVGLTEFAHTQAIELPYGRKRALEIATTLAMEPELMLLDEPTQGMGLEDVDRIRQLIKKVAANRTVLMVEHNMSVVASIADTITVLQRGATLAEGPYEVVSKNPAVIEAYMGSADAELKGAH